MAGGVRKGTRRFQKRRMQTAPRPTRDFRRCHRGALIKPSTDHRLSQQQSVRFSVFTQGKVVEDPFVSRISTERHVILALLSNPTAHCENWPTRASLHMVEGRPRRLRKGGGVQFAPVHYNGQTFLARGLRRNNFSYSRRFGYFFLLWRNLRHWQAGRVLSQTEMFIEAGEGGVGADHSATSELLKQRFPVRCSRNTVE